MGERAQVRGKRDVEKFLEGSIREALGIARLALEATGSQGPSLRKLGVEAVDRCLVFVEQLSALDAARLPLEREKRPIEGETLETLLVTVLQGREGIDRATALADAGQVPVGRSHVELAATMAALLDAAEAWSGERGFALRVRRRPSSVALYLPPPWGRAPAPVWRDLLGLCPPHPAHVLRATPGEWRAREAALRAERIGAHLSLEWSSEGGAVLVLVLPDDLSRGATTLS